MACSLSIPIENPYCSCKPTRVRAVKGGADPRPADRGPGRGQTPSPVGESSVIFADIPSPSLLIRLLKGEGGAPECKHQPLIQTVILIDTFTEGSAAEDSLSDG